MYTRYQVVLIETGFERVLSEWQARERAYEEARKEQQTVGTGKYVEVRAYTGAF